MMTKAEWLQKLDQQVKIAENLPGGFCATHPEVGDQYTVNMLAGHYGKQDLLAKMVAIEEAWERYVAQEDHSS
jgi:hypothetical protein